MVGRRLACAVLAALCATSCAARKSEPEVVGVEHQTHVSGSAPAVTPLEPGAAAAPAAAAADPGATATATAASTAVDPEPTLRVVLVEKASAGDGLRLVAQLSREPSAVRSMELHGPRRCVVDVDGPAIASRQQQVVATQDPVAPRLRVGSYPDHLRLVLDVESGASAPCEARLAGSAVVIGIGAPPVGTEPEIVWLASALPDGSRAHASEVMARALGGSASADVTSASSAGTAAQPAPPTDPPASQAAASPPPPEPPAEKKHQIASAPPAPPLGTALAPDVPPGAPVRKYTGRRISLEFKDADILNVLRIIADVANKNIVATDDVKGRVTIVLRDVPWDQALDILLKSTGLEQVEFDDVITVSTAKRLEEERKARLAARQAGQQLEPLRTEYIRVNYVKAGDLANILQGGAGTSGAAAVAAQEIANQAPIGDAAGQRRGLLSGRGSVQVNEATNTLIVRDIADGLANARELVRRLDVQTPQVAIQGLIFEADVNSDRSLGIRWGAVYNASPETGNPTGKNFPGRVSVGGAGPTTNTNADGVVSPILVDFPAPGVIPGSGSTLGLLLGSLSGSAQIDAQLTALETAGKGKVISRPKVVTLNNTEATIQSLEILRVRLPSSGTVINTGAGGTAGAQTVATQAIDTGIILRVTPQVSSDGYVLMQMFVKSSVPSQQSTDNIPNEISRQATSQVLVREGETVVIGGVYRQRTNFAEAGLPWLRTIPVFGWLFKNQDDRDDRQELLVFITPRVVWQTASSPHELPSASELWDKRALSAYRMDPVPAGPVGSAEPPASHTVVVAPQG
ncbi:MAG TPA: type IV pilus secretin PilQ [Candidatus Binatia bacterium]|nr:type IV pilus secretin PilQ [Candidatus Binatia bacterium]